MKAVQLDRNDSLDLTPMIDVVFLSSSFISSPSRSLSAMGTGKMSKKSRGRSTTDHHLHRRTPEEEFTGEQEVDLEQVGPGKNPDWKVFLRFIEVTHAVVQDTLCYR